MSRKLLAFLIEELETIRIRCKHPDCGLIIELKVADLFAKFKIPKCPGCNKELCLPSDNGFIALAAAARAFANNKDRVEIEFVIPEPPTTKQA
jgi:hypothetical protein